jgi:hypothetical protein
VSAIRFHVRHNLFLAVVFAGIFALSLCAMAEQLPSTYKQGSLHGFLLLKNSAGKVIATGEQTNVVHGNEVHSELMFHFRDGSIDDEVTDYRQDEVFALIRDHHVQKGPSFPKPLDLTIDVAAGEVTWDETKNGKTDTKTQHMDLPGDLMNGMLALVVEDFPAKADELKVSYLVVDSGPRVVGFTVTPQGEDKVRVGGGTRKASRYNIHVEIGGLAGVIAPIIGKKPADMQLWAIGGDAPLFIGLYGALYPQGPMWTMGLISPTLPSGAGTAGK